MKTPKKRKTKSKSPAKKATQQSRQTNLDDLGLEPPKIYRETQRQIYENMPSSAAYKKNNTGLSKTEKRVRDNKKRKKKNAFRKFLIWASAIVLFVSIGTVLSLTVFFNINNITITGSEKYSKSDIMAQCTIDKGENLFLADTKKAKATLEQNLPYIYNAKIKRKLPDTIEIKITEAAPAYSIKCSDKTFILLDDRFKVLELGAQKAQGIRISKAKVKTSVLGKEIVFENEDIHDSLVSLAKCVKENNFKEITAIYSNNISDNYVVYDGRIKFRLGNCDDLTGKIYQGLAACEQLNESNPSVKGTMTILGDKSVYFTEE